MSSIRTSIHGQWSSRLAFILAVSGSAVGLGNIWKFPYITGKLASSSNLLIQRGNKYITNEHSRRVSHVLRSKNQGLLTSYKDAVFAVVVYQFDDFEAVL